MRTFICFLAAVSAISCADIAVQQVETTDATSCVDVSCNRACIAIGWKGGSCFDGYCRCGTTEETGRRIEKPLIELTVPALGVGDCQNQQCNQACIDVHFEGGYCKDGECWCWKSSHGARVEKLQSEIHSASNGCETESCKSECQGRRFESGSCNNAECKCTRKLRVRNSTWSLLNQSEFPTNYKDKSGDEVEACTEPVQCLEACQHHGAMGGFCLKRICWCSMSYDRKKTLQRRVRPISELQRNVMGNFLNSEDDTCERTVCKRQCRATKEAEGLCLHGYCWCSDTKRTDTRVQTGNPQQ